MARLHSEKCTTLRDAVKDDIDAQFGEFNSQFRFTPYFAMHETEALYFSCPSTMANHLGVNLKFVNAILEECKEPEAINHCRETSPSHRIATLIGKKFNKKTTTGIAIAQEIGLQKMREQCPVFNHWVTQLEDLRPI